MHVRGRKQTNEKETRACVSSVTHSRSSNSAIDAALLWFCGPVSIGKGTRAHSVLMFCGGADGFRVVSLDLDVSTRTAVGAVQVLLESELHPIIAIFYVYAVRVHVRQNNVHDYMEHLRRVPQCRKFRHQFGHTHTHTLRLCVCSDSSDSPYEMQLKD